ncbi:hypothetical protein IFM61392_06875 [Aspergillus lentulus]|nr:hypothetical protein IFM61392_06875 [Aspergillus lentulus]
MAEQLLLWLNGRVDFRHAYTMSWSDIVALLADIAQNPGAYGVLPQNVANLRLIHADITRLRRPDGPSYLVPPPPQNIDRKRHPKWPSALSRFRLTKSTYDGVEYWALPDLLGLFMSTLGRAPTIATKRNFYLPLTAVYGQWCSKLIRQGRLSLPSVVQCSWTEDGEFHLGASRGGCVTDSSMGSWLAVLDRARYGVIRSPLLQLTNWSQAWTPTIRARGRKRGTPFGRCAETYPVRKLLMGKTEEEAAKVHGLDLWSRYVHIAPAYDDRLSGRIWESLWDPCDNCQVLISINKGNILNFGRLTGSVGAPP